MFVVGLALLAWQRRRRRWSEFVTALGLALALGGVGSFLLGQRWLGRVLVLVAGCGSRWWFILTLIWKRTQPQTPPEPPVIVGAKPVLKAMLVLLLLAGPTLVQTNVPESRILRTPPRRGGPQRPAQWPARPQMRRLRRRLWQRIRWQV